jgi:acylphosphatase
VNDKSCCRFLVSGRVQGVSFRFYTARKAVELGLLGSAINLPDGRVEVVALGDEAAVESLGKWLQQGSPLARVDRVERFQEAPERYSDRVEFTTA